MKFGHCDGMTDLWTIGVLWILHFIGGASGQFDANFTLQNVWGRLQTDSRSIIQCLGDDSYKKIKFSRKLDTGQGSRLPKLSQQFMQAKPVYARILFMPGDDKLNRFGAFQCKIAKGDAVTEIVTLKLPPSGLAELDAVSPYLRTQAGSPLVLEVTANKTLGLPVKWRHNGAEVPAWEDKLRVEIQNAKQSDAGVYESFYEGRRKEGVHALIRVIVKKCPNDIYGDNCDQDCPPCYNGGICHDVYGECVCPAGFTGPNCEIACGGNHFGADCSKFCSPPQNNSNTDELCASHLFCKPDPYGCSCAPGFKGASCMDHCEPGWYGADCEQPCHCAFGSAACNRITGACSTGGCAKGWRGHSCQIEDPNAVNEETTTQAFCPSGWFGASCEKRCRCVEKDVGCDVVSGFCRNGCEEGFGGPSCSACRSGRFGDNCESHCHCEGGHHNCDKDGFCHAGCEAGWSGFTCQTECTPGRFGTNCASTCHCHPNSTDPCHKISGACEGDCEAGYMGKDCQTLCPFNKYGVNCVSECVCMNGGHCNRIDGSCDCEGRWKGTICNESEPQIVPSTGEETNVGQQVFISCSADAVPEPAMNITSSSHFDEPLRVIVRNLEQNQYQAVIKVRPKVSGQVEFQCTASNRHGFDREMILLTVIEPPQVRTAPWVLQKSNESVTLGWKDWEYVVDVGGSASDRIEYLVIYREKEAADWIRVDEWTTEVSGSVSDLLPNADYEMAFKCRRLGKGGEGPPGPSITVKTECGVATAEGLAREVLPHDVTESSITLSWKKPFEVGLRCPLQGYHLSYHPEADESILQWVEMESNATRTTLDDLTPNTLYVIRLYAVTGVGRSKYAAEISLRTADTTPDPVTHLECQSIEGQPTLLQVSWEAPSEVNGVVRGYVINYTLTDSGHCGGVGSGEDRGTRQMLANDTEVTLSSLHPYSVYNVSVQARTAAGEGEPVYACAATAEAEPDDPPPGVRALSSTSRSLEFGWDPVPCDRANGMVTHYSYMVVMPKDIYPMQLRLRRKTRTPDVPVPSAALHDVEGLRVEIKNLDPNTEYGFMVAGVNGAGTGPMSDVLFHWTKEDKLHNRATGDCLGFTPKGGPETCHHILILHGGDSKKESCHIKLSAFPGVPRYLTVSSSSPQAIGLLWSEPSVPNGRVSRYRIRFRNNVTSTLAADVTYAVGEGTEEDEGRLTTLVRGLTPDTVFAIQIQAATSAGWGNYCSPVYGRTLDGIPGEPSELTVRHNGLTTLNLTWKEPGLKNGRVLGYQVTYRAQRTLDPVFNATPFGEDAFDLEVDANVSEVTLTDLHPSTEYDVSVRAKTSAGYGIPARIAAWTVILGDHVSPSLKILEAKATNQTIPIVFSTTGSTAVYKYQVIVEDSRNEGIVDERLLSDFEEGVARAGLPYYIAAEIDPRNLTSSDGERVSFVVGDGKTWGGYHNVRLNPGYEYKIRVRTFVYKDDEIKTVLSEPQKENTAPTSVQVDEKHQEPKILGFDVVPFILVALGILVFLTACTFLALTSACIKRRRKKASSLSRHEFGRSESLTFSVMYRGPESEGGGSAINEGYKTLPVSETHASLRKTRSDSKIARGLRIESLHDFLANALATNQLEEEFQRLEEGQISSWTVARKSANIKKNRYGNILPYDRHRVVLLKNTKNESDYINASYIDGYRRSREYIVTQGPLDHTIDDFWRMVWQENVPVIVMVTDLVENGKKKCSKYWPEDSMMCGDIQILLIRSEVCPDFVVRTMLMRKMDEIITHRVEQYQFTAWPDRTVPLNTNYFVKFLKRVRQDHPVMAGPMLVHCSAGAGRSGTYVAIDALFQQGEEDKRVEVFRFVNNARHQRTQLVQTLEQYTFIYEALVEAFQFEDTSVPLEKIGTYLKELDHMSTVDHRALIRRQYNKLNRNQKSMHKNRCSVALSEYNVFKNRDCTVVPLDAARVRLQSEDRPDELSDYINAVFVDGYRRKNAYLATQTPMSHTTDDFWRMVYQNNSSFIVMLDGPDETDDQDVGVYWPDLGESRYGDFLVQVVTCDEQGEFITRIMTLTHYENANPRTVIQLQYRGWCSEMKAASMIRLLQYAELCYNRSSGSGPIAVHCMDGATRTGLFIAARNVCEQIRTENLLDVYQTVKGIRSNRTEFIPNADQYRFLFEIAQELLSQ